MGLRLAAGLAGFSKRGMQFNDEQRQLTNDNIKTAVNLVATDALEQRRARKTLKAQYVDTAQKLDSLGLNGAQIEAAYARFGNDAGTEIGNALKAHTVAWQDQQRRDGKSTEWTKNDTIGWLNKTIAVPEGAVSRPFDVQAAAFVDTRMPQTTADFGQLAQNIVAGSGEITMRPSDKRADAIRNQMAASFQAASGGIQETQPGAVFNASGATVNMQPNPIDALDFRTKSATTVTAENQSTITGVEATFAEQFAEGKLEALTTENLIKEENLDFLQKNNPLLIQQIQGRITGQDLSNTLAKATQGDQIAISAINRAIAGLRKDALGLDVKLKELKLEQDPQLFEKQMEQLGLNITAATYDNMMKKVDASTAGIRASLGLQLQRIQVEQGGLRTTLLGEQIEGEQNKNALAGVNSEILDQRLALLKEQVANAQTPATFQAAILEIDQAIQELDPSEDSYSEQKDLLENRKDQTIASLALYTDATTRTTSSSDPKFPSLVNAYNKSLAGKMEKEGFVLGTQLQVTDNGISWIGKKSGDAYTAYQKIRAKHDAQYYTAIEGYEQGGAAAQALGLQEPERVPLTDVERQVGSPSGSGMIQVDQVIDYSQTEVGDIYRHPDFGLGQIVIDSRGRKAFDTF